jgi:hypothetical protein
MLVRRGGHRWSGADPCIQYIGATTGQIMFDADAIGCHPFALEYRVDRFQDPVRYGT